MNSSGGDKNCGLNTATLCLIITIRRYNSSLFGDYFNRLLGALLAGAAAANLGWHVTYLGASLPAAEVAGAARQQRARAVALSLVYPEDDARLEGELLRLRELLPFEITLLAGGRALPAYRETLDKIGALPVKDLAHFSSTLDDLRKPAKKIKP